VARSRCTTPGPRTGISAEDTAGFLLDFAAALGIRRAVWIGHSLGAQAVAELAARRPDRAAGLVLVGPTGEQGRGEVPRQVWALTVEAWRTSMQVRIGVARDYIRSSPARYIGTWLRHTRQCGGTHALPRGHAAAFNRMATTFAAAVGGGRRATSGRS
jgi:pimeloyl-ACP methyl ester carboxylesterase